MFDMKNAHAWKPTKFTKFNGEWRSSSSVSSAGKLITNLAGRAYDEALTRFARGRLIDLGCGAVPLYGVYRELVSDVVCVDWPGSAHDVSYADQFVDLNSATPYENEAFDTILSTDVLEHIWNHATFWAEIARILRPGGTLILGTPFFYWLHEEPHDYFRWTAFALKRACAEVGLTVIKLVPYGGALDILADVMLKTSALRMKAAATVLFPFVWGL
jgi:2-polyprenyl-3-methyl-5-hydroxy-6-metoxy-1,4-benzoquinol methylase